MPSDGGYRVGIPLSQGGLVGGPARFGSDGGYLKGALSLLTGHAELCGHLADPDVMWLRNLGRVPKLDTLLFGQLHPLRDVIDPLLRRQMDPVQVLACPGRPRSPARRPGTSRCLAFGEPGA